MSARATLVSEGQKRISNPFLLCALISKRTRQLMTATNESRNTAQIIETALKELTAGALEFKVVGRQDRPEHSTEGRREEGNHRKLTAADLRETTSATSPVEPRSTSVSDSEL